MRLLRRHILCGLNLSGNMYGHSNGEIMRLNGWQRIGLVSSAVWALGAALHIRNEQVNAAEDMFQFQYRMCLDQANPVKNCSHTVSLQAAMDATAYWPDVAFYAVGPVIAGWFIVLITISTIRWVSDGFSKKHG
jgi:hypothetical protein